MGRGALTRDDRRPRLAARAAPGHVAAMKLPRIAFTSPTGAGLLLAIASALAAAPAVKLEFSGVDAPAQPVRVALVDPASKEQAWVPVGGNFAGCEVRGYDPRRQRITLARGTDIWELALEGGRPAAAAPDAEEAGRIVKQVTNNLRQIAAASDQYFLEYGISTVRLDQLVGPDKYIRELKPADGEDYAKLKLDQSPVPVEWTIVTGRGVTVRYRRN